MSEVTFAILKIVISVCAALVTAYVLPYIKTLREDTRYAGMLDMIGLAVKAAEQQITASGQGAAKKARVLEFMREWLGDKGIDVSYDQLSELIEAAVFEMRQEK